MVFFRNWAFFQFFLRLLGQENVFYSPDYEILETKESFSRLFYREKKIQKVEKFRFFQRC